MRAVPNGELTGVLVLRVWIEAGTDVFRARMTAEDELGSGERVTVVAGSLEEILEFIRTWVVEFVGPAPWTAVRRCRRQLQDASGATCTPRWYQHW